MTPTSTTQAPSYPATLFGQSEVDLFGMLLQIRRQALLRTIAQSCNGRGSLIMQHCSSVMLLVGCLAACMPTSGGGGGGSFGASGQGGNGGGQRIGQDGVSSSGQDAGATSQPAAAPKIGPVKFVVLGDNVFPTYIAHLFGITKFGEKTLQFVKSATISNPGSAPIAATLTAELQGFSFPATVKVDVPAGGQTVIEIPISFKIDALYAVSATVAANVVLTLQVGSETKDTLTKQVQIAPKNTVFWATKDDTGKYIDFSAFVGVFVTPHDKGKQIDKLITASAVHSQFNGMIGYQALGQPTTKDADVGPGDCKKWPVLHKVGDKVSVDVSVTCAVCFSFNAQYYFMDAANHEKYQVDPSSSEYILGSSNLGVLKDSTMISQSGVYWHMACNPGSNDSDRQYTVKRTIGANEAAMDQIGAIFLALKSKGMVYTSVATAFFDAAQNIKTPAESLESGSQNCIDGTLVFASALESLGMESAIVKIPGHAFVAVRADPKLDAWFPIETVMVSSGTVSSAIEAALKKWSASKQAGTMTLLEIKELRSAGIGPAPF